MNTISFPNMLKKTKKKNGFTAEMKKHWQLYIMGVPAISFLIAFAYLPIVGLLIAFKDFNFKKGIFFSDWSNPLFKNFEVILNNASAWNAIKNTLLLNCIFIFTGTVFSVTLAIMLNEIGNKGYKKITQSATFLPFFISWIVVGMFASSILNYDNGTINRALAMLGFSKINFYMEPQLWPGILTFVNIWKSAGYSAIVYLATITGFSTEYYEAAKIDGCSKWKQIRYITLPLLKPTVIVLVLLAIGNIMRADFGLFFFVTSDMSPLYPTTDVIDTFIYRGLRVTGSIGISSAAGLFQSVVSFFIVIVFNKLANKFDEGNGLF